MRWCLFFSGLALLELTASTAAAQKLFGIPTLKYQSVEKGSFDLSMITRVVVDKAVSEVSDKDGATLLAPTLMEFAATFAADLTEALGREIPVAEASESSVHEVFLTLSDTKSFRDAAGYPTSEGYKLHVAKHTLQIVGASPLGVWWATRSILQQLALRQNLLAGLILDAPGWGTRGIMVSKPTPICDSIIGRISFTDACNSLMPVDTTTLPNS
jgi:hexosaminidase